MDRGGAGVARAAQGRRSRAVSAWVSSAERPERIRSSPVGPIALLIVATLFVAVSLPVVLRGAPLADDFVNCLEPQRVGLSSALGDSLDRLGVLRKAHLLEIVITTGVCQHLPFGFAIAVPLALTLAVAGLLRALLRDLGVPGPWPELAGALWLLHPVGAEAALWPAALHVPLGLALALSALRLHRSGHHMWGSLAVAGACLSVEQMILALPIAVWLTVPPERRRAALALSVVPIVILALLVIAWPGDDPRLRASLSERLSGAVRNPAFLPRFAAVGLGAQSIPLAILWSFPVGVALLAAGALLGWRFAPDAVAPRPTRADHRPVIRTLLGGLVVVAAINAPVVFNVPQQGSPRLFAPTWLVICAVLGIVASEVRVRRPQPWGAAAGAFAAAALLSLALSAWVRVESAGFTESASRQIAPEISDDADVGLCGVTRTVVEPAPRGAFFVHEFIYEWAAREAVEYYTGKRADFSLAGDLWATPCPTAAEVDRVFAFSDLVSTWRADG
jgi:hypothetical protein